MDPISNFKRQKTCSFTRFWASSKVNMKIKNRLNIVKPLIKPLTLIFLKTEWWKGLKYKMPCWLLIECQRINSNSKLISRIWNCSQKLWKLLAYWKRKLSSIPKYTKIKEILQSTSVTKNLTTILLKQRIRNKIHLNFVEMKQKLTNLIEMPSTQTRIVLNN